MIWTIFPSSLPCDSTVTCGNSEGFPCAGLLFIGTAGLYAINKTSFCIGGGNWTAAVKAADSLASRRVCSLLLVVLIPVQTTARCARVIASLTLHFTSGSSCRSTYGPLASILTFTVTVYVLVREEEAVEFIPT